MHILNVNNLVASVVNCSSNIDHMTESSSSGYLFSKLKEVADDNFQSDENGRKFFKQVENTVGIGEIAHHEQFLLFPQCS